MEPGPLLYAAPRRTESVTSTTPGVGTYSLSRPAPSLLGEHAATSSGPEPGPLLYSAPRVTETITSTTPGVGAYRLTRPTAVLLRGHVPSGKLSESELAGLGSRPLWSAVQSSTFGHNTSESQRRRADADSYTRFHRGGSRNGLDPGRRYCATPGARLLAAPPPRNAAIGKASRDKGPDSFLGTPSDDLNGPTLPHGAGARKVRGGGWGKQTRPCCEAIVREPDPEPVEVAPPLRTAVLAQYDEIWTPAIVSTLQRGPRLRPGRRPTPAWTRNTWATNVVSCAGMR